MVSEAVHFVVLVSEVLVDVGEYYGGEVAIVDAAGTRQTSDPPSLVTEATLTSPACSLCDASSFEVCTKCIDTSQYSG